MSDHDPRFTPVHADMTQQCVADAANRLAASSKDAQVREAARAVAVFNENHGANMALNAVEITRGVYANLAETGPVQSLFNASAMSGTQASAAALLVTLQERPFLDIETRCHLPMKPADPKKR